MGDGGSSKGRWMVAPMVQGGRDAECSVNDGRAVVGGGGLESAVVLEMLRR